MTPCVTRESTLLRNLTTNLHSVRQDLQESDRKSREQPMPELQNTLVNLGQEGVGGARQAACRH